MIKKIISALLITIFSFLSFSNTNANYYKSDNKLSQQDIKNIEKVFVEINNNYFYESRWVKTKLTKEWLKNVASALKDLPHYTITRWVTEKTIWKRAWEKLFENFRSIAYKLDKAADTLTVFDLTAKQYLTSFLMDFWFSYSAASTIAKVLIEWYF